MPVHTAPSAKYYSQNLLERTYTDSLQMSIVLPAEVDGFVTDYSVVLF